MKGTVRAARSLVAVGILGISSLAAQEKTDDTFVVEKDLRIYPHAHGHFEAGQIVEGTSNAQVNGSYDIRRIWTENALLGLSLDAVYRERLRMRVGLEGKLYFSYPMFPANLVTKPAQQSFYFTDVNATSVFGAVEDPFLRIQTGYFTLKYNPDARNLGEYLFRSGTYPAHIYTSFDFAAARLLGFNVQSNLFQSLQVNALFTTETFFFPIMNWSLSGLASYDVAGLGFAEIGAGVSAAHLLSVYGPTFSAEFQGDPTTPKMTSNSRYVDENGDTLPYTFKGTKVMGRLSINPKAILKSQLFGEDDLKLYAELCVIGWENYPSVDIYGVEIPSYDERLERMPVALGFNLPTFRLLDILNLEVEWFGSRYLNDATEVMKTSSVPLPARSNIRGENLYKWSVYLKKGFFDRHFFITAQFARDHMRLPCAANNFQIEQELLPQEKDWWWVVKTSWAF